MQKERGLAGRNEQMENAWQETSEAIDSHMEAMDWHKAFDAMQKFFWDRYCSEFIETSKKEAATDSLHSIMIGMEPYMRMLFRIQ